MALRTARPRWGAGLLAILLIVAAVPSVADSPLTTADVVRFLKAGISERTTLAELATRGFAEPLDAAREAALREAGATETLVVAIRRAAPPAKASPPASAAPPMAEGVVVLSPHARPLTFAADTRTVRVPVSVFDKRGQPVLGLKAADFRVLDDGKKREVTLFSSERRALRLALALDVSGSMHNKIRQVEAALRHFIDLLEPEDEILVITFGSHVRVLQDFTADRQLLSSVLDKLEPSGGTALYDAAAEAIRRVAPGPAESKAVVIVSDGVDTSSTTSFDALLELARRSEVPVFSIGLDGAGTLANFARPTSGRGPGGGYPVGRPGGRRPGFPGGWPGGGGGGGTGGGGGMGPGGSPRGGGTRPSGRAPAAFNGNALKALADETGGRAEVVSDTAHYKPGSDVPENDQLKAAVESIAMALRHRYLIGYEPPEGGKGWHTIRIDCDRVSATARAKRGYYSAG